MIPVFAQQDGKILGYMDELRADKYRAIFQLVLREPMPFCAPSEDIPSVVEMKWITFRWERKYERREEKRYYLDTLITDGKLEDLIHIVGFRSFIEYHGQQADYFHPWRGVV